ncbi:MAG TPA: HAMP domain-containing sensor histidine kinase [Bacteroidia bacterium]|nr:HAMP domain-containing sensor histidine kinase [Bacteroidia bacterium]
MKPLVLFYLLVLYVLLQFTWWAYLLIELNTEVYTDKIELLEHQRSHNEVIEHKEEQFHSELKKRWTMVIGEGMVFLSILLLGIYRTRIAFKKEYALARQQKNFLLSITHEFKSPLAAVKLNLQTLQKRELARPQQEHIIFKALNETERIHTLVENALLAARIEGHSFVLQPEELDLADCILSVIESRNFPENLGVKVTTQIQERVYVMGDRLALTSVVLNLLENAEKYSPDNSEVSVSLFTENNHAVIRVADQGKGVPEEEKSKIFNKFYRVGNEDTRNAKGTGLGLFIVSNLVDLHKGTIVLEDNFPTGAVFKVILPLVPDSVS